MGVTIGIRREDKNRWERRVPLAPGDVAALRAAHDLEFVVQPSPIRVFADAEYAEAGARVEEDLSRAGIVVAVKEIPLELLRERTTYLFFSHTVKGQRYNMPLLQRILDLGATLIDYERIVNEQNRRLIFFSLHAGYAGMVETLGALGRRLEAQGRATALADLRPAHEYGELDAMKAHLREVGARLAAAAGDEPPLVVGLAGYGNVAAGCREMLACLPAREVAVADLSSEAERPAREAGPLLAVTFREEHMVEPRSSEAQFVLQDTTTSARRTTAASSSVTCRTWTCSSTPSTGTRPTRAWSRGAGPRPPGAAVASRGCRSSATSAATSREPLS